MTDAVSISIVTSTAAVVMAVVSAYFAFRAKAVAQETHTAVNSRMTEFMEMAKKSFRAEGASAEKAAEAVRQTAAKESRAEGAAQEKSAEAMRQESPNV